MGRVDYDPANDSRRSYELCISELRKQLLDDRTVQDKTALAYFAEEDGQIYLCVKADRVGFWRFPVTPEKVLDVVSEGARLARLVISRRASETRK